MIFCCLAGQGKGYETIRAVLYLYISNQAIDLSFALYSHGYH
jgi:hypothetical protein